MVLRDTAVFVCRPVSFQSPRGNTERVRRFFFYILSLFYFTFPTKMNFYGTVKWSPK